MPDAFTSTGSTIAGTATTGSSPTLSGSGPALAGAFMDLLMPLQAALQEAMAVSAEPAKTVLGNTFLPHPTAISNTAAIAEQMLHTNLIGEAAEATQPIDDAPPSGSPPIIDPLTTELTPLAFASGKLRSSHLVQLKPPGKRSNSAQPTENPLAELQTVLKQSVAPIAQALPLPTTESPIGVASNDLTTFTKLAVTPMALPRTTIPDSNAMVTAAVPIQKMDTATAPAQTATAPIVDQLVKQQSSLPVATHPAMQVEMPPTSQSTAIPSEIPATINAQVTSPITIDAAPVPASRTTTSTTAQPLFTPTETHRRPQPVSAETNEPHAPPISGNHDTQTTVNAVEPESLPFDRAVQVSLDHAVAVTVADDHEVAAKPDKQATPIAQKPFSLAGVLPQTVLAETKALPSDSVIIKASTSSFSQNLQAEQPASTQSEQQVTVDLATARTSTQPTSVNSIPLPLAIGQATHERLPTHTVAPQSDLRSAPVAVTVTEDPRGITNEVSSTLGQPLPNPTHSDPGTQEQPSSESGTHQTPVLEPHVLTDVQAQPVVTGEKQQETAHLETEDGSQPTAAPPLTLQHTVPADVRTVEPSLVQDTAPGIVTALDTAAPPSTTALPPDGHNDTREVPHTETTHMRLPLPLDDRRWGEAMTARVAWQVGAGIHHAQVQLNPPDLGPVGVRVEITENQARVHFQAEHPLVRESLQEALPRLREMFSQAGLNLADTNVSQWSAPGQQGQNQPQRHVPTLPWESAEKEQRPSLTPARRTLLDEAVIDAYV